MACLLSCSVRAQEALPSVTVLADKSLSEAMVVLAREYARGNGATVNAVLGETPELRKRIEEGEAADVFVAAAKSAMDLLEQQGLLDVYTRAPLARSPLVLIANPAFSGDIAPRKDSPADALAGAQTFILATPTIAVEGRKARAALEALGWWPHVAPKVLYTDSLKVGEEVGAHPAALGLTSRTNAHGAGFRVLGESDTFVNYHMAVVAGERMAEARKFVAFLKQPQAGAVLQSYGFEVLP